MADFPSEDAEGLFDLLADANENQFETIFGHIDRHREKAVAQGKAEVTKTSPGNASEAGKEALAIR